MRTTPRPRQYSTYLVVLVCLALLGAAPAEPLEFDDLTDLVRAEMPDEIILTLLEAGPVPALTVAEWIELRTLGASDELLLALRPDHASVPESDSTSEDIRVFYLGETEADRTVVLTNLDEQGRRLGDTAPARVRRNIVAGRTLEEIDADREYLREEFGRDIAESHAAQNYPVPQAPASPRATLLPEYIPPPGPVAFVPRGMGYGYGGFFWQYPFQHLYPPGSYSHFKVYHQGGEPGFGHYQLPAGQVFYNPPFPTAGSHRPTRGRR